MLKQSFTHREHVTTLCDIQILKFLSSCESRQAVLCTQNRYSIFIVGFKIEQYDMSVHSGGKAGIYVCCAIWEGGACEVDC